jgi:OTU domain-containing protein 3
MGVKLMRDGCSQLSDPATNNALLSTQLRSLGLYAASTVGDGNCLFRALSDQLLGTPNHHLQLRAEICDWIALHKARYEPFVEDDRGIEVHLRNMRTRGQSYSSLFPARHLTHA